jgi:hypothetical protein
LLEAVLAGNKVVVEELLLGSLRADGTRHHDGLRQVLPYWARGTATLDALRGVVVVDETQDPVTVTVHWEQVPRKLRKAAASLASELVDDINRDRRADAPEYAVRKSQKNWVT